MKLLIETKMLGIKDFIFIMLINVKMPTVVGILTFMGMINFMLNLAEHKKSFINVLLGVFINIF